MYWRIVDSWVLQNCEFTIVSDVTKRINPTPYNHGTETAVCPWKAACSGLVEMNLWEVVALLGHHFPGSFSYT